jgi:SAM-dependent methyltransferase
LSTQDSRGGAATSLRDRRVARVIDREIAPIWHDRFARLIVRNLPNSLPNAGDVTALDIHCGVGRTTAELLGRLGASARVLALEPDDILLELARTRMRPEWKNRVYLKPGNFDDVTGMADDAYNLVIANLVLGETGDVSSALAEMIRVNRIGGRVLATLPLAGSWTEVEDIFSEVLRDAGLHAAVRRLDRLRELRPTGPQLAMLVRQLGVAEDDFVIEQERFHMLFPSGREFLFAPVVEHGPLRLWKAVIGKDGSPQELFWRLKEAIDIYYAGHVLSVNVLAGLINIHVAKGTESPGPRLAARYWRHYPTLDALWGGLAAGYVRISEPVPFTDGDLDFDLEIDDGERRTGAQKAITTSINIITDDLADEPDLPSDTPALAAEKPAPAKREPTPTKREPSGPKTPATAKAPASRKPAEARTTDDFDAAFAEYNPPAADPPEPAKPAEREPDRPLTPAEPATRRNDPPFRVPGAPTSESGRFKPPTAAEPNAARTTESGKFKPPSKSEPHVAASEPGGARPTSESGRSRPPTSSEPNVAASEPGGARPASESGRSRPPTSSEPNVAASEPSGARPTSESGKFNKPPAKSEQNAASEPSGTRPTSERFNKPPAKSEPHVAAASEPSGARPTSESGRFNKPPTKSEPNVAAASESSATPTSESLDATQTEPTAVTGEPAQPEPAVAASEASGARPASEASGARPASEVAASNAVVADLRFRGSGERAGDSGSAFRRGSSESSGLRPLGEASGMTARPMGEQSGLSAKPGEPSGFFRPPTRPGAEPGTATGSFKVFAPPKPRDGAKEAGAPASGRIRRNSQPLGLADVPKALLAELDADPATELAFDKLMDDTSGKASRAAESAKSDDRPAPSEVRADEPKSLIAGLTAELAADARPIKSLMAELDDLETTGEQPPDVPALALALSLTSKPSAEPAKPEPVEPAEPEPRPRRSMMLEATITPSRPEPEAKPAPEPAADEDDEVEEAEELDELDEQPVETKPAKPAPPPLRPAKSPPPPPSGAFKPRPLLPIVPPKKK